MIDVPMIKDIDFSAEATLRNDGLCIKLTGSADARAIMPLSKLLPQLHSEATRIGVKQVIVDLHDLEFMNSSCFKSFVTWISTVQEASEQYRVMFLSNPATHWQKRSLHALSCFGADLISIETSA